MKIECKNLNRVLREGTPELMEALEKHADACPSCRRALDQWSELSKAAGALDRDWKSPELWLRIQKALAKESQAQRQPPLSHLGAFALAGSNWRQVTAVAISFLMLISVGWILTQHFHFPLAKPNFDTGRRLLTERALHDVEISELAYVESIDRLSKLVEPKIDNSTSPLLAIYREKLKLIDGAIAECRAGIERNPLNAHMRKELLAMYQEKQHALEDVVRTSKNE